MQEHRRYSFNPWVRKIPSSRKWHPTPVFLPGKFHGQRSLMGYSPWGHKIRHDWTTEHICCVLKEYSIIVLNNASLASIILEFVIGELRVQFLSPSYLLSPCALPCDFGILFRDQNAFLYPLWPALAKAQDRSGGRSILSEASGGLTYFGLCLHHGNKPGLLW